MPATTYTYSIATDTPNQQVEGGILDQEIRDSAIVIALDYVNVAVADADELAIVFKDVLSAGDQSILDGLVGAHTGEKSAYVRTVHIDALAEEDGKLVITPFPARDGFKTFFTGRADDLAPSPPFSGRGGGTRILEEFTVAGGAQTKTVILKFSEPVQVHDGQAIFWPASDWSPKDYFTMRAHIPATATVVNGGGAGNCFVVPTGLGFNAIVPAAGNGTHDVDLATAAVVPTPGAGHWEADSFTGLVSASPKAPLSQGSFSLFDIPIDGIFANEIPMGQGHGVFDIEAYRVEDIWPNWELQIDIHKNVAPTVDCIWAGWLLLFRPSTSPLAA